MSPGEAHRGLRLRVLRAEVAPPNPSLQRTRLRSPLNSVSLGGPDPLGHLMHLRYCSPGATPHLQAMRSSRCVCSSFSSLFRSPFQAILLGTVITLALSLSACSKTFGPYDLTGINPGDKTVNLYIQNLGLSDISISWRSDTKVFPAGATTFLTIYSSFLPLSSSDSFTIQRQAVSLAQVSFRLLHFPDSGNKNTTMVVGEPLPGHFSATAVEPSWIEVLSVTPMP
jgi:hypothetical protein